MAWQVEIACELSAVPSTAAVARQFLLSQGCTEHESAACELALVEGCNNAILHAASREQQRPVAIEVICQPQEIEVRITDHTAGFDWPARPQLPGPEEEHGRGLYLIRTIMDSAAYHRGRGENVLVLHKHRTLGL